MSFKKVPCYGAGDRMKRLDFSRAKWDKFKEGTTAALGEVNSDGSIDEHSDSLITTILRVASKTFPYIVTPRDSVIVQWWNKDCEMAVRERSNAFRNLRKNPTLENPIQYKRF